MDSSIKPTGTYVTSKGYKLIAKLLAGGGTLQFTRAAVGTGKVPEGFSPESLTGLTQYKMDAELAQYGVEEDKAFVIVQVSSQNVSEGFLVTEVGIFASDPDEGEILYGYMDISGDPTYIYAGSSTSMAKFAEFQLYFLIGQLQRVTAAITPGAFVSREALEKELEKKISLDGGELGNGTVNFDDTGSVSEITSLPSMLQCMITGNKLAVTLRNLKAGLRYVLHVGSLVNNCVSSAADLPLAAAQGKVLQDQINVLNAKTNKTSLDPITTYNDLKVMSAGCPVYVNGVINDISYPSGIILSSSWAVNLLLTDDDSTATFIASVKTGQTLKNATYKNL